MYKGGSAPPEEKAERMRIYNAYASKRLPFGDVHFYILTPEAQPLDGISVNGLTTRGFIEVLEKTVRALRLKSGSAVVTPRPQSVPPAHPSDALVFQVIARGSKVASYREFPSENWIIFSRDEGKRILPGGPIKPGLTWDVDRKAAVRWLAKFYPQGVESGTAERSRIDRYSLKATVLSVEHGIAYARMDGTLLMKRAFTPGHDDNNFVHATLLGFVTFNTTHREIQTLRLVTTKARYGPGTDDEDFSAVLRSMSPDSLRRYLEPRAVVQFRLRPKIAEVSVAAAAVQAAREIGHFTADVGPAILQASPLSGWLWSPNHLLHAAG